MDSFEKLFVNSTNRFSAVRNIIISQNKVLSASLHLNQNHHPLSNKKRQFKQPFCCGIQQPIETLQQLQQKYLLLKKNVKQANKEKQIMNMLFDKIFKIQQGEEDKLRKRFRRKKDQIQSKFQCNISQCSKIYSSSASLVRHTKLKHAYSKKAEPPSHNYSIPPSPNLVQSNQVKVRRSSQDVCLQSEGNSEDEDGDAKSIIQQSNIYEADCESSVDLSEELERS